MIWRLSVLAVLALASACGGKAAAPPAPQPVSTMTMRPQPTSLTQEYPAQLEASNTVEIRPQVAGILSRQVAIEGTPVKRGQMLFEIDPQPYIAALAQAQAGLAQAHAAQAQAERDLARARPLTAIDALSQRELDAAVAANDSAQSQVKARGGGGEDRRTQSRLHPGTLAHRWRHEPGADPHRRRRYRLYHVADHGLSDRSHVREFQRRRAAPAAGSARAGPPARPAQSQSASVPDPAGRRQRV